MTDKWINRDPEQLEFDFATCNCHIADSTPCPKHRKQEKSTQRPMGREELLILHRQLCEQARELMLRKNHDYAAETDLFRNFRRHGRFGIVVRLDDKLARLQSFLENGGKFEVTTETLQDTIIDIINYAVLFAAYQE